MLGCKTSRVGSPRKKRVRPSTLQTPFKSPARLRRLPSKLCATLASARRIAHGRNSLLDLPHRHLSAGETTARFGRSSDATAASRPQRSGKHWPLVERTGAQHGERVSPFISRYKTRATKGITTMTDLERREFIQGIGIIAGAATTATLITEPKATIALVRAFLDKGE
jgi:hypothetical protein